MRRRKWRIKFVYYTQASNFVRFGLNKNQKQKNKKNVVFEITIIN